MAGIPVPPTGEMKDNNGKPIYFDSIDNSAYILGKAEHSARKSWIFINGEYLHGVRVDIGGDPNEPWVNIAWKFVNARVGAAPLKTMSYFSYGSMVRL